jgi:hypothetical protein
LLVYITRSDGVGQMGRRSHCKPVGNAHDSPRTFASSRRAKYDDLPTRVVEVAKKAIVDMAGAGLAGSAADLGKIVFEMGKDVGGEAHSCLYVHGVKFPTEEAAFINAVMARCRELDDVLERTKRLGGGMGAHVSTMVVPCRHGSDGGTPAAG